MPPAPHLPAAEAQDHAALIAALDAGDLAGAELTAAESLVASCGGCTALADDLVAIRGAMSALPTPARRRDYRLTAEDAARLRPSGWRRLLEWLAAPGSTVRPLATGLATLGVIGLLLTSGAPGMLSGFGSAGAAPVAAPEGPVEDAAAGGSGAAELQRTYAPPAASGAPAGNYAPPAASGAPAGNDAPPVATAAPAGDPGLSPTAAPAPMPEGTPTGDEAGVAGEAASADPTVDRTVSTGASDGAANGDAESAKAAGRDAASTVPLPVLASLALLVAGLALLAGRQLARRRVS
jgi:hypothetical protein